MYTRQIRFGFVILSQYLSTLQITMLIFFNKYKCNLKEINEMK